MQQTRHYESVIFDLDGTLLNTLTDLHAAVNKALVAYSLPPRNMDDVRTFLGNGYLYLISHCMAPVTDEEKTREVLKYFENYYYSHSMDTTAPYEGIPEVIDALAARHYRLAIVSNKGMDAVRELAAHFFGGVIPVAIGESADVRRKPAPDTALEAMRLIGAAKESSLYVGDSEVDIATARNAGIDCLSVSWGFRTREHLIKNGATHIVDRPGEIIDFLKEH